MEYNNKELLFEKGQLVLDEAEKLGASQVEVTLQLTNLALTRIANSIIDQNVAERHAEISTIVYYGKQQGSITVEVMDDDLIKEAVADAVKIAKISPENKDFKSLPKQKPYSDKLSLEDFISEKTIEASPEQRADYAMKAVTTAEAIDDKIKAFAGAVSNHTIETAIMNSLGIEAYCPKTLSTINLTVLAEDNKEEAAGWSADRRKDFTELKIEQVAKTAARKAAEGFGMKVLDPGEYEVILEPAAVGGFMFFMGYFGFSAMMYQDYMSFLRDKIGDKVFSEKLTLWDDAYDERLVINDLFDDEGVPKQKIELITNGVVKNLVYDTLTADKDEVKTTGHNAKFRGRSIPVPTNLLMKEGDSSLDEMITETKNGLLVTHFHYQNSVNPQKGIMTGLTRDGAWYIKNGEIQHPVTTLRYTDALPRFLSNIDLLGSYSELSDTPSKVPPIKLPSFSISGSSKE
jgi:predicted Zn-dependent protease